MILVNVKPNIPKLELFIGGSVKRKTGKKPIASLHYHDELEFLPIYSGKFLCRVDGKDYIASEGEIIFINARIPHETAVIEDDTSSGLLQFKESNFINT